MKSCKHITGIYKEFSGPAESCEVCLRRKAKGSKAKLNQSLVTNGPGVFLGFSLF